MSSEHTSVPYSVNFHDPFRPPGSLAVQCTPKPDGTNERTPALVDDYDSSSDDEGTEHHPRISPYAVDPVILQFGGQVPSIPVSQYLLDFEPGLLSRVQIVNHSGVQFKYLELGKLYADVGHTLVNFIHTGEYETLQCSDGWLGLYRCNVHTYTAAREFRIRNLDNEAMKKIKCLTDTVDIFEIVDIAEEVWHILFNDDDYRRYLEAMIVAAFRFEHNPFKSEQFMKHFGTTPFPDHGFVRFLAGVMERAYSRQLLEARGEPVEQGVTYTGGACDCERHSGKRRRIE